jgi:hypothetical protein
MEAGTGRAFSASKGGMDDIERAAIAAEGYDPDDPAVVAALARVSAVLAEQGRRAPRGRVPAALRPRGLRGVGIHNHPPFRRSKAPLTRASIEKSGICFAHRMGHPHYVAVGSAGEGIAPVGITFPWGSVSRQESSKASTAIFA